MSYAINSGLSPARAVVSSPIRRNSNRSRQKELATKFAKLQRDYVELHAALYEAAQVYRRLCAPHLVKYHDFEIASETFAVRHVPGDFFTIKERGSEIILALGDVCGKGLAAGMWTPHLVGLVTSHTAANAQLETIASGVNRDLCQLSSLAPLASLFLATLDPTTGTLEYCSAGHPPALLLRSNGALELLSEGGPLLGVVSAASFNRGHVQMLFGDTLLVCSDGILESFNETDQEFGNDRLVNELRHAQGGAAGSILFSVLGAVQDFAAPRPLTDDMTLVIVNRMLKH